jgi:hypothetical protein
MSGEEELAFLKAHLGELSPAFLRQLKRDIVAEKKRREAAAAAKAKGSGERPTGQPSGRQPGSAEEETAVSQKAPLATAGKRKANEVDSSDSGGSMEPATRRPAPGPRSGAGPAPLPAQAKGRYAQGPVVLPTASTGEQAAFSGRHLSYAEVGAAYARVVAGRPVKGATARVDSSAPLPTKKRGLPGG